MTGQRLPPLVGLPSDRPHCAWCQRPIRFRATETYDGDIVTSRTFRRWIGYGDAGYGSLPRTPIFCTLRCATFFAQAAYRVGYRRPAVHTEG